MLYLYLRDYFPCICYLFLFLGQSNPRIADNVSLSIGGYFRSFKFFSFSIFYSFSFFYLCLKIQKIFSFLFFLLYYFKNLKKFLVLKSNASHALKMENASELQHFCLINFLCVFFVNLGLLFICTVCEEQYLILKFEYLFIM